MRQKSDEYKFEVIWSKKIRESGFTRVPDLLTHHRGELRITDEEYATIVDILTHKWSTEDPWPSTETIASYGLTTSRTIRRRIQSLEDKGYIQRLYREGYTNLYSIDPLIKALDELSDRTVRTGGQKHPLREDNFVRPLRSEVSAESYAIKSKPKNQTQNPSGNEFNPEAMTKAQKRIYRIQMDREREQLRKAEEARSRKPSKPTNIADHLNRNGSNADRKV